MKASQYHETLAIARELVRRWLDEELRRGDALASPEAVRSYLRLMFAGEEREVFVALFLDTQNRLIAGEKLFFGTLAQTSVYPREVVKRTLQLNAGARHLRAQPSVGGRGAKPGGSSINSTQAGPGTRRGANARPLRHRRQCERRRGFAGKTSSRVLASRIW